MITARGRTVGRSRLGAVAARIDGRLPTGSGHGTTERTGRFVALREEPSHGLARGGRTLVSWRASHRVPAGTTGMRLLVTPEEVLAEAGKAIGRTGGDRPECETGVDRRMPRWQAPASCSPSVIIRSRSWSAVTSIWDVFRAPSVATPESPARARALASLHLVVSLARRLPVSSPRCLVALFSRGLAPVASLSRCLVASFSTSALDASGVMGPVGAMGLTGLTGLAGFVNG